jgi:hypothetical protein
VDALRVEMLSIPHFLDNWLTDGGEVVSIMHWLPFTSLNIFWYSFLLEDESTLGPYTEGLGKLKKKIQ